MLFHPFSCPWYTRIIMGVCEYVFFFLVYCLLIRVSRWNYRLFLCVSSAMQCKSHLFIQNEPNWIYTFTNVVPDVWRASDRVRKRKQAREREREHWVQRDMSRYHRIRKFFEVLYTFGLWLDGFFSLQLFTPLGSTNNCRSTFESSSFYIRTLLFFGIVYNNLNTHSHIASPHFACKHRVMFREKEEEENGEWGKKEYTIARHTAERIMSMFTDT